MKKKKTEALKGFSITLLRLKKKALKKKQSRQKPMQLKISK